MRSTAPRDNEITLGPKRVDLPTYRGFRRSSVLDKCESGSPATLRTGIAKRAARMPKRPGTLRHESRHNGGARRGAEERVGMGEGPVQCGVTVRDAEARGDSTRVLRSAQVRRRRWSLSHDVDSRDS